MPERASPGASRRLVYLGTPELAVAPLVALVQAGHQVELVITRPDRRRGRGTDTSPSPVKIAAERLGIPVSHSVRDVLAAAESGDVPALGVVVAYGRMIPEHVLDRVPMVNLHFSLLPRWRGAAPVERAILAGDSVTGVSVMALEPTFDTGPVYVAETVAIEPGEHVDPLRGRLAAIAVRLLVDLLADDLPEPQRQEGEVVYADKIEPGELELRWDRPAEELGRVVRLDRAFTTWRGRRLRVLEAEVVGPPDGAAAPDGASHATVGAPTDPPDGAPTHAPHQAPGTLLGDAVVAGDGAALRLVCVQPEGRSPMEVATWLRGARPQPGERFELSSEPVVKHATPAPTTPAIGPGRPAIDVAPGADDVASGPGVPHPHR